MITPEQLKEYVLIMREQGVLRFKSGEVDIVLGPSPSASMQQSLHTKDDYEKLLFAATEGIADDDPTAEESS